MAEDEYDLVVVGGGIAGYTAAIYATRKGLRTLLVEQDQLGGVCLHRGCIPTKSLLEGAYSFLRAQTWSATLSSQEVWRRLHQRKAEVVAQGYDSLVRLLRRHRIQVEKGRGSLVAPGRVAIPDLGKVVETRWTILATGSSPIPLKGLPWDGSRILSSDHLLELDELPQHLIVVGGGVVGVEFASLLLDLGVQVTIVEIMPRLMSQEDREISRALEKALSSRGASVLTGARPIPEASHMSRDGVELAVAREEGPCRIRGTHVLVAVGRTGNVQGLGLEDVGVAVKGGFIQVGGNLRTTQEVIYAIGDVAGGPLLAHKAAQEGRLAVEDLCGGSPCPLDRTLVPRVAYCRPQVAAVGLTEEEATALGFKVRARRFSFRYNSMAHIVGETEGFVKVVYDQETGRLLGVHALGHHVEELIGEAALALKAGVSLREWADVLHPHPSIVEALGEAVRMGAGTSIYL